MVVYNYTVSEFNPAEVPSGGMIACHAPLFHFDLHDGDKDLYFISGQISNAVDGSMYTLVNGHFTDLVGAGLRLPFQPLLRRESILYLLILGLWIIM